MGCIADEVQAAMALALPEVQNVTGTTMAKPGDLPYGVYQTMDYARLVAPLCAAVGELKNQVTELKLQVQKRKSRT